MRLHGRRQRTAMVAGSLGLILALGACGSGSLDQYDPGVQLAGTNCDDFAKYGKFKNSIVNILSTSRDIEATRFEDSFVEFEVCTGIQIKWEGDGEAEKVIAERVAAGIPPDLMPIAQPGMLANLVRDGAIKRPSAAVVAQARKNYSADWLRYSTFDGEFYAPPLGANVKSFVWYSPSMFEKNRWEVPQTWDALMELTEKIKTEKGITPWCAGIYSPPGPASGWPGTDWIEDVMLRTAPIEDYDKWIRHEIPFNHESVQKAFEATGEILRNPQFVNGGFGAGDVQSINTTSWMEAGAPILDEKCVLHRAASFYGAQWEQGVRIGPDADVFAFYLPAPTTDVRPVLGGGEFLAAFNTRKETQAVQLYLGSDEWTNKKAKMGEWISPSRGLVDDNVENPIDKLSVQILQNPATVFRFDASDLMPGSVGAGTFWKGMIEWFDGATTDEVLDRIEASWPE